MVEFVAKNKLRRTTPNHFALSKVFAAHGRMLMMAGYIEHEKAQESMMLGYDDPHLLNRRMNEFWPVFQQIYDFRNIDVESPDGDSEYDKFIWSSEALDAYFSLDEIFQVYQLMKRSIDFEAIVSKQISKVLKSVAKPDAKIELLSSEQFEAIRSLVFDAEFWVDKDDIDDQSHWHIILAAHQDIIANGELSNESGAKLQNVLDLRKGLRRQRKYSDAVLIVLLAEFYEDRNTFGYIVSMSEDPVHLTKTEHTEIEAKNPPDQRKAWTSKYVSPFHRFFEEYVAHYEIGPIGSATVAKVVKNRKKCASNRISHLLGQSSGANEYEQVFEYLDAVKA